MQLLEWMRVCNRLLKSATFPNRDRIFVLTTEGTVIFRGIVRLSAFCQPARLPLFFLLDWLGCGYEWVANSEAHDAEFLSRKSISLEYVIRVDIVKK